MLQIITLQVSPVLIEIGVVAGIIIGVVQICLMIFRKKKPVERKDDENEHV